VSDRPEPHVVALLPRGEAIRNFVQSDALDLVAAEVQLTVLSVRPNDDVWHDLERRYPRVIEIDDALLPGPARVLQELLELGHGRRLWSEAAQERWRRRDVEAGNAGLRRRAVRQGKKVAAVPLANDSTLRALARAETRLAVRGEAVRGAARRLAELRPTLLFSASQVHGRPAMPFLEAAAALRIPTATFCFSWDNLTSQGRIHPLPDEFLVWNEQIGADLRRIYPNLAPSQVHVTGTPQFDRHFRTDRRYSRAELCHLVGLDPQRPFVLYTTGMPNHMPGEPALVEQLADELAELVEHGPPQLVVRVYAKDRTSRFDDLRTRRSDIVFSDPIWDQRWLTPLEDDAVLWTGLLEHCAAGVNVASTVTLELCMFDKPVINLGYNPPGVTTGEIDYARYYRFDHYRPIVASGALDLVTRPDALGAALADALDDPRRASDARAALLTTMFGDTLDGKSAQRVADQLVVLSGGGDRAPKARSTISASSVRGQPVGPTSVSDIKKRLRTAEPVWRYGLNRRASLGYLRQPVSQTPLQRRLVADLRRDGVARTSVVELLGSDALFEEVAADVADAEARDADLIEAVRRSSASSHNEKDFIHPVLGAEPLLDTTSSYARLALALRPVADAYYRMTTQIRYYNVWRAFRAEGEPHASQLWHRDREDLAIVKAFVYLDDVDGGSGPFHYVPGTHRWGNFHPEVATFDEDGVARSTDAQVALAIGGESWWEMTGPRGTVLFADTTGLHNGGFVQDGERLLYVALFTSPASGVREWFDRSTWSPVDDGERRIWGRG
jgi:hypothetical protein